MTEYIAANPGALIKGGVDLAKVSSDLRKVTADLEWLSNPRRVPEDPHCEISKAWRSQYLPAANLSRDFFRTLTELVVSHGMGVVNTGRILSNADDLAGHHASNKRG